MIQLYECPSCGRDTAALALVKGGRPKVSLRGRLEETNDRLMCPACSPVPDKVPHDFQPVGVNLVMVGGVMLEQADPSKVFEVNLVSGVCCADPGDCGHACGVA